MDIISYTEAKKARSWATQSTPISFSATGMADGALPTLGVTDSGHPYEITSASDLGFDIVGGALQTDASLAYFNWGPLNGPVREYWMELEWSDDSEAEDEIGVLIVSNGPFANNYPEGGTEGNYSDAGAHVLLYRDRWSYQKRDYNGPPQSKHGHYYPSPLAYGQKHRIGLLWDGETAVMVDPDGTRTTVNADTDYALWWGNYGCMELLGTASGKNKVRCHSFTATSEVRLSEALWAGSGSDSGYDTTVTSGGTTALTSAAKRTQVFTGSTTETVQLPSSGVESGWVYTVVNLSSSSVLVQASNGSNIVSLTSNRSAQILSREDDPTASGQWHLMGLTVTMVTGSGTIPQRDGNANITADNFITGADSTATAAGTTTLTLNSKRVQVFTGTTTQFVDLPTTQVVAGQEYTIINNSTGIVTVRSSNGTTVLALRGSRVATFVAVADTPTGGGDWQVTALTSTDAGPNTAMRRDTNSNVLANNFIHSKTSTATAAGTLTMGINYPSVQEFTGTSTHTVRLPSTSVVAGQEYTIINNSTDVVTVQSSATNSVDTVAAGSAKKFLAQQDTPTTAAHWRVFAPSV